MPIIDRRGPVSHRAPFRDPRRPPRPALMALVVVTVAVLVLALLVAIDVGRAADASGALRADTVVPYRPPVDAPILDPYRAPTTRYGPGNRGIDYAVAPGTAVRAMADGEVIFAGPVAGALHVTVRHGDGLRSSYSFLAQITVHVGQVVRLGDPVGRSAEVVHVGVRDPAGNYLDPASLFGVPLHARLVPGGDDGTNGADAEPEPAALAATVAERAGPVGALLARGSAAASDLLARARLWQHVLVESDPTRHAARAAMHLADWGATRDDCTDGGVVTPAPGAGRILVEVGGIGSTSSSASVTEVATTALGYGDADVIRFSYRGGRVPGPSGIAVAAQEYDAQDSQQPLSTSADALAALLRDVATARPGVPIDVVAHSQGGIVARAAVVDAAAAGQLPPEVAHLVTVASPHQGADAAGAVLLGQQSELGRTGELAVQQVLGLDLDVRSPATRDLAPGSTLLDRLDRDPWPESVPFTSIAARGDVVVPGPRTAAPGARSVTVDVTGLDAHSRVPGAEPTTRELALALADRPPSCRGLTAAVGDLVTGEAIALSEARASLAAAATAGGPR